MSIFCFVRSKYRKGNSVLKLDLLSNDPSPYSLFFVELKKLEKLDAIEATLKNLTIRLGNVESTIDKIKEDARAVESSIKGMDKSLTYLNKEVEELRGTVEDKDKQIEYLHTQHLYLESYSRRENLKFFGIPENEASASQGRDAVGTIDVLCEFLHDVLGFGDPKRNMEFQRVHRIGKSVRGKPRPILARFFITGAQPKAGTGHKMQHVSVFSKLHC